MGGTRAYNHISGIESPTQPTPGTPVGPNDVVTLGTLNATFARGVADVAALKAIAAASRGDNLPIYIKSLDAWFFFDAASSSTGNDVTIVQPTVGSGRWFRQFKTTRFTIVNNQASFANVTSVVFDKTKVRSFEITLTVYRSAAGGSTRAQRSRIMGVNNGTTWEMSLDQVGEAGLTLDLDATTGQLVYKSDDNGGSYVAGNSILDWSISDVVGV